MESARTTHGTFGNPPVPVDMEMETCSPTAGIDLKWCFGNKEADRGVTALLQFVSELLRIVSGCRRGRKSYKNGSSKDGF